MIDLFELEVEEQKLSKNFIAIRDGVIFQAARHEINEIFNRMGDQDGNFREQFQTNGFDARLWELYLFESFRELNLRIESNHSRPDFELKAKNGTAFFVEAVTANPSPVDEFKSKEEIMNSINTPEDIKNVIDKLSKQSVIRMGSALYSKLKKKYWELDWVKGKPFVIAIAPFYNELAQMLSDATLIDYLYGINFDWHHNEDGTLIINTNEQKTHEYNDKIIPSGFFGLEGSEYVSAVVFSNAGTISKFNRIGTQKGFGSDQIKLVRNGVFYDPDPNASTPIPFGYEVKHGVTKERWSQELRMFHNPNALYPIDNALIPQFAHGFFEDNQYHAKMPKGFILQSETLILKTR